ncbi:MAG: glycine zipper 2TM domain-containing protein [Croceibacterium sp.]
MRRIIFAASIAGVALMPINASAQTRSQATCEQQSTTRVVATVAWAGVGGVLGNVVAGHDDKTLGTIIGAAAGALIGNQVAKPGRECNDAYGYYDKDNRWHATGISSSAARGYYDRDGGWVDGPPNGRYADDNRWMMNSGSGNGFGDYRSQGEWVPASANGYYDRNDTWVGGSDNGRYDDRGRWIAISVSTQPTRRADAYGYYDTQGQWHATAVTQGRATGYYDRDNTWVTGAPNGYYDERRNWVPQRADGSASGSYDSQNRWIPASSNGYYDDRGQWIAGTASGHYDTNGRWTAGVTVGHYDDRGRWIAGDASGHRNAAGQWIADPQPGYYDSRGHWNAGETSGYYDGRGRWVSTGIAVSVATSDNVGADNRPTILSQLSALDQYVRDARSQRSLSNRQATRLQRELRSIRTSERAMTHSRRGNLSDRDEAKLQDRIDHVNDRLGINAQ